MTNVRKNFGVEEETEKTEKCPKWKNKIRWNIFICLVHIVYIPLNYILNNSSQGIDCCEIQPLPKQNKDKTFPKLQGR